MNEEEAGEVSDKARRFYGNPRSEEAGESVGVDINNISTGL